jgi:hypothetical protein
MKFWLLLLFSFSFMAIRAQSNLGSLERKEIGGKVSVLVPSTFVLLSDNEVAARYPSSRKPLAVYSNVNGTADFGINKGRTVWEDKDLELVKDFYKANMMAFYNKVVMIKEGIVSSGNLKFAELVFIGSIESLGKGKARRYVHVRYAVVKNRLYIAQFNCPASEQGLYSEMVEKMMKSIRISKKGEIVQESSGKKNAIKVQPRK